MLRRIGVPEKINLFGELCGRIGMEIDKAILLVPGDNPECANAKFRIAFLDSSQDARLRKADHLRPSGMVNFDDERPVMNIFDFAVGGDILADNFVPNAESRMRSAGSR